MNTDSIKPPKDEPERCERCDGILFDGEDGLCESCDTDREDDDE